VEGVEPGTTQTSACSPDGNFLVWASEFGELMVHHLNESGTHLLPGPGGTVQTLWIDPRGYWIAALTKNGQLSYWPVPRGRPLQDLPLQEFMEVMGAQTNIRVAADPSLPRGFREVETAFPGWEKAPVWQEWYSDQYMENPPWKPRFDPGSLAKTEEPAPEVGLK